MKKCTKEDLRHYINDFENKGYDEFECLCIYCDRCISREDKPDDCQPDADNENCLDAFKELVSESYSQDELRWAP